MPTPPELALIGMIGAVEWVIDWVERQSTAMKLGVGMLLGVAATMAVAAIYAWLVVMAPACRVGKPGARTAITNTSGNAVDPGAANVTAGIGYSLPGRRDGFASRRGVREQHLAWRLRLRGVRLSS